MSKTTTLLPSFRPLTEAPMSDSIEKRAADRLMAQVRYNARNCETPTPAQVGAVLHALADFTAINSALSYRPDPDEPGPHGGKATSIGRWFHAVGDVLDHAVTSPGGTHE